MYGIANLLLEMYNQYFLKAIDEMKEEKNSSIFNNGHES